MSKFMALTVASTVLVYTLYKLYRRACTQIAFSQEREAHEKREEEWRNTLNKRIERFGPVGQVIRVGVSVEKDIYHHPSSRTLFILGVPYSYKEIRSFLIEQAVIPVVVARSPIQEKYAVRTPEILRHLSPDREEFCVSVGVCQQMKSELITFKIYSCRTAEELRALFQALQGPSDTPDTSVA